MSNNPNDFDMDDDERPHGIGFEPSLCDGDTTNNEWFTQGVCLLDTMSKSQVIYSIERNPKARMDLKRVTRCEELQELLRLVPLLSTTQEDDAQQRRFNSEGSFPYRGNCSDR